jgi:cysteine desulfurase/selenocysteine lyase
VTNLDIEKIRRDFPILNQEINGRSLAYLDNAATTQKPKLVLEAVNEYNHRFNGNPHRGAHYLGVEATRLYEGARTKIKEFINAGSTQEIIFTKNATEALNLIAYAYGMTFLEPGDEIVICISEHHSNLVCWQQVAGVKGAVLKYLYLNDDYTLDFEEIETKITTKTKLVSIAQMSNVLGTIYPVEEIAAYAHSMGAVVVVDAAQSAAHMALDVQALDADFLVFSGHKMLGPMGIGVLYGKKELLGKMPPFLYGGDMIEYVEEQSVSFAELPYKFEAGTQNVEGAVGLAAAVDYLSQIGFDKIQAHERELTKYALERLAQLPYVQVYGPRDLSIRGPVISFTVDGCHPHDTATILDHYGVAVRAGHHCAQPLMNYLEVPATSRASFYLYNTKAEIDNLVEGIKQVRRWLGHGS